MAVNAAGVDEAWRLAAPLPGCSQIAGKGEGEMLLEEGVGYGEGIFRGDGSCWWPRPP